MSYFEFDSKARILSGEGALSRVKFELDIRKKVKPFVISDHSLDGLGITKTAIKDMALSDYSTFLDVVVDSSTETVNSAVEAFKKAGCDCVIAIGGGSVIDTAKGLVLALTSGVDDLSKLEGMDTITENNKTLFIAVPTTAGTGSEMTNVAVIKDAKQGSKLEYISTFILPDISVLDPKMTISLPARITASTAIDALTHAVEAYTCLQKNPVSDGFAITAIKLIFSNLEKVIENPKDIEGRMALANAATLAGMAFSNSMVGGVHSIGHALGGVCGVAHGDAMGILLANVLVLNYPANMEKLYSELLLFANEEKYLKTEERERPHAFIEEIRALMQRLNEKTGLPITLSQTGKVKKEDFDKIVEKALNDGSAIVNPVQLTKERILEILEKSF